MIPGHVETTLEKTGLVVEKRGAQTAGSLEAQTEGAYFDPVLLYLSTTTT